MVIRNFIKYAPPSLTVRLVGIEATPNAPVGEWQEREFAGRPVSFYPLFRLLDDDRRKLVPTSLRYAIGLLGKNLSSDFMHFHRLEPTIATGSWRGHKTLFVHNDIYQQMQSSSADGILWKRFPKLYFGLERMLMSQFNRILSCNSESTKFYKNQYSGIAERISFVRNTFDGEVFYPLSAEDREQKRKQEAAKRGLSEDTRFLLFAGRLHPQKDPLLLLEALSRSAEPRVHLLVAGNGELEPDMIAKVQELNISERVTFLGALPHQEIAEYHRLASALVLTSAYEGLPLVVLEALACGTPVVTTRTGETPRLLHSNCGIVCQDRTPAEIARALDLVLSSPEQFPSEACVENALPYSAKRVIEDIYAEMFEYCQPAQPERQQPVASV